MADTTRWSLDSRYRDDGGLNRVFHARALMSVVGMHSVMAVCGVCVCVVGGACRPSCVYNILGCRRTWHTCERSDSALRLTADSSYDDNGRSTISYFTRYTHLSYDDCLEDRREDYQNCCAVLCTTSVVHNDTHTHMSSSWIRTTGCIV